jgi:hypothetical protein
MRISDVHSNRKQRQLTVMLVTVNLAFYLFTTPAWVMYILELSPPKHQEITKLKRSFLFAQISVVLLQLNNAVSYLCIENKTDYLTVFSLDKFYILLFCWTTISSNNNSNI